MSQQAVIPAASPEEQTFGNFDPGRNQPLVDVLRFIAGGGRPGAVLYLWGEPGSGKSHLLHASCARAARAGRPWTYLVGGDALADDIAPEALVCIDDLDGGHAGPEGELRWLTLYERVRQEGGNLVVAAAQPPSALGLETPDLESRLSAGGVFHLVAPDDESRRRILAERAHERGFELSAPVMDYIMRHHARDMGSLFALLDRIDRDSLAQHRRITLPFLRDLLTGGR